MIDIKDKVMQFKRDMKSYSYYENVVKDCDEKLEELSHTLLGVSSPSFKTVMTENNRDPYHNNKLELWYEEEQLISKRDDYMCRIEEIDAKLSTLETEERSLIENIYKHGVRFDDAMKGKYRSRTTFFDDIKKILSAAIMFNEN